MCQDPDRYTLIHIHMHTYVHVHTHKLTHTGANAEALLVPGHCSARVE